MHRIVLTALAALALLLALLPAAPAAAAKTRQCGLINDGGGLILAEIKATGTTCRTARLVARGWRSRASDSGPCGRPGDDTCTVRRYACRSRDPEVEATYVLVRCRLARRTVSFTAGS